MTPPAVIVLGMPRSGTTLLKEMLDHHPALAMAPESYFIPSLWRRFRVRRNARHLLGDLAALPQLRLWGVDLHDLSRRVRSDASFADVMAMVYGALAAGRERPRYGDKTTTYREDLGILERAFPGAQYLHVIRDGRDAALSYQAMGIRFGNLGLPKGLGDFAWRWRIGIARARRFGEACGPARYREVRYERLVAEPESVLTEICSFLGMEYHPEMLAYHRDLPSGALPHHPRLAEPPSLGTRNWRQQMPRAALARFEALSGDTLSELGYERSVASPGAGMQVRANVDRVASEVRVACWRSVVSVGSLTPFWRAYQGMRFRGRASVNVAPFGQQTKVRVRK